MCHPFSFSFILDLFDILPTPQHSRPIFLCSDYLADLFPVAQKHVAEPAIMDQALETLDNVLQISAQVQQIAGMIQVRAPRMDVIRVLEKSKVSWKKRRFV